MKNERVLALALAAVLPACGSGDAGTTPSTPERTRIAAGSFNVVGTEEANQNGYPVDIASGPFGVANSGTLEIIADWTSAANNIDIVFYTGSCLSAQAIRSECPIANRSTGTTTKPESLTIIGVPAGNYSVGFANFGLTAESGTFEVFLTR
jgi:type IV pilus biogenesis protein CpaD/CtpE